MAAIPVRGGRVRFQSGNPEVDLGRSATQPANRAPARELSPQGGVRGSGAVPVTLGRGNRAGSPRRVWLSSDAGVYSQPGRAPPHRPREVSHQALETLALHGKQQVRAEQPRLALSGESSSAAAVRVAPLVPRGRNTLTVDEREFSSRATGSSRRDMTTGVATGTVVTEGADIAFERRGSGPACC